MSSVPITSGEKHVSDGFVSTLLGPSCTSLNDPGCQLLFLSKVIGLGILVLGSVLKLPSVFPVLRTQSTRGLPILALLLETFGFTVGIASNIRQANPFTTWGEAPCLLAANLVMLLVHWKNQMFRVIVGGALYAWLFRNLLSSDRTSEATMQTLLSATVPAFMGGTVLQILANFREKHIGAISPATLTMGLMCGLGRMLTTFVEVEDPVMRLSSALGTFLGFVMWAQMIAYREGTRKFLSQGAKAH
ncbi:uncharacterized protein EV422DRAFT_565378 [Fimicolochytrium jonesii]|uniref:uncharacterized protein n=1 Tax=Fimicolochytrium jonesii TaxID=1396493 RepID=UPI0022FEC8F8|nr:uncharacterized protein EV422DRAFT_565378 [Fimicolochytrium jonesii]KAI8823433.1 hypothetical protein EV422DRAFT_565378 [Fimicolochytrium jonesii]